MCPHPNLLREPSSQPLEALQILKPLVILQLPKAQIGRVNLPFLNRLKLGGLTYSNRGFGNLNILC